MGAPSDAEKPYVATFFRHTIKRRLPFMGNPRFVKHVALDVYTDMLRHNLTLLPADARGMHFVILHVPFNEGLALPGGNNMTG